VNFDLTCVDIIGEAQSNWPQLQAQARKTNNFLIFEWLLNAVAGRA
jgi:hypothetical protein